MKDKWRYTLCLMIILLALCVNEGRGKSRGGSRSYSRGGGYSGGSYSGGSYGGGGSAGTTIGIVCGVIGGIITICLLICLCVVYCKRAKRLNNASGTSGVSSKGRRTKRGTELRDHPPPYYTIGTPIYNVQNEMMSYGYLPQTEFRTYSTPNFHTPSSTKSHTTYVV